MNTESIPARRVPYGQMKVPGDFCFDEEREHIYVILPGMKHPDAIRIEKGSDRGHPRVWGWDGNEDKPTLQPSIHCPGEWHGYLTEGELKSC